MHDDILLATGITDSTELDYIEVPKRKRNPSFAPAVLETYGHRCAVCEFSVSFSLIDKPSHIALDAAHIKWHAAGGPDSITNGLALCAVHHRLFDRGAFTLSSNLEVIVAYCVSGKGVETWLEQFHDKQIHFPKNPEEQPDSNFIQWHTKRVFKRQR